MRVPGVVRDGCSTGVVRGEVTGRYGYDVPVEARVVHTSALARILAAPVRPRPATGLAVGFGVAGLLALWNLQLALMAPADGTAWAGAVFFGLAALGSGARLRTRRHRVAALGPWVAGGIWLWHRSWYCRRCDGVSVLTPRISEVFNAEGLAASLVSLSRRANLQQASASPR